MRDSVFISFSTHVSFWVKFDQKSLPFEGELADLGPGECVDLGIVLKHYKSHVGHCQVQRHSFVVLRNGYKNTKLGSIRL